jgi:hypothetical protein
MTDALAGLWEIRKLKELYQYAYNDAVGAVDVAIVTRKGLAYRAARVFQLIMLDKKPLGSRLILYSQKMTMTAMAMADMKTPTHLS